MADPKRLPWFTIREKMQAMKESGKLAGKIDILLEAFADDGVADKAELAMALYPEKPKQGAMNNFRMFRRRFNEQAAAQSFALQADKSPTLWFISTCEEDQAMAETVEKANAQSRLADKNRFLGAYEESKYIPTRIAENAKLLRDTPLPFDDLVPAARFPRQVDKYMSVALPEEWASLVSEDRNVLCLLAVCFEPFLLVDRSIPCPPVVGFELLAMGPDGARFGQLLAWAADPANPKKPRVSTHLLEFALLTVALLTTRHYFWEMENDLEVTAAMREKLFFSINMTPAILKAGSTEAVHRLFQHFHPDRLIFEVHESFQPNEVKLLRKFKNDHNVRLALDDAGNLDKDVASLLAGEISLIKADHKETKSLLANNTGNFNRLAAVIRQRLNGVQDFDGFVLEGIKPASDLQFLVRNWKESSIPLLAQGWGLNPEGVWKKPLISFQKDELLHCLDPRFGEMTSSSQMGELDFQGQNLPGCRFVDNDPKGRFEVYCSPEDETDLYLYLRSTQITPGKDKKKQSQLFEALLEELDKLNPKFVVLPEDDWRFSLLANRRRTMRKATFIVQSPDKFQRSLCSLQEADNSAARFLKDDRAKLYSLESFVENEVKTPTAVLEGRDFFWHWLDKEKAPFAVLLGDFGIGKTFLCRMFTRELLEKREYDNSLQVPIYIDLRLISITRGVRDERAEVPSLIRMLTDVFERQELELDARLALQAARAGHLIFIMDGIDEQVAHLTKVEAEQFIRNLREIHGPPFRTRTILACRTHYFKTKDDEQNSLRGGGGGGGFSQDNIKAEDFHLGYALPFDLPRIKAYLDKAVGSDQTEGIIQAMSDIYNLLELGKRPYLLSLIIPRLNALVERGRSGDRIGAGALYETLVEEWLNRDIGKHFMPDHQKPLIMGMLAHDLWRQGVTQLHHRNLGKWVTSEVRKFLMDDGWIDGKAKDVERCEADVRTATFLIRDDDGNFSFVHRSFGEFFLARHIMSLLSERNIEVLDIPLISKEVADFFLDLLTTPEFAAHIEQVKTSIKEVLVEPYRKMVSDNCLFLLSHWQRVKLEPAPRPSGINLSGADLTEWDLSNMDMIDADLTKAIMVRANLSDADFRGADFSQADLRWAKLHGTNLTGAKGDRADLAGSDWEKVLAINSVLRQACLIGARIHRCDFSYTDFTESNLSRAVSAKSDFSGCSWPRATVDVTGFGCCVDPPNLKGFETLSLCSMAEATSFPMFQSYGHSDWVNAIAISHDGSFVASGSSDKTIRLWDAKTGRHISTFQGHLNVIYSVIFSPDSKFIASSSLDKSIRLWSTKTGKHILTYQGHQHAIYSVTFSPCGAHIASGSSDKTIRLWDTRTGKNISTFKGHQNAINSVNFSPNGNTIASGSDDNTIRLWDAKTGKHISTFEGHQYSVRSVVFSPDGNFIASGADDNTIRLWDAKTGKHISTFEGHQYAVRSVAFSPNGNFIASGGDDKTIRLWDAKTGKLIYTFQDHQNAVRSVVFLPSGNFIASGALDKTIRLWDAKTGKLTLTFQEHQNIISSVAFSPAGNSMASGSSGKSLQLWDAKDGKLITTCHGHRDVVCSVAFSLDGKFIASASLDSTIRLWEAKSAKLISTCYGHRSAVYSVAFSPDSKLIVSGSSDKSIRLWDAKTGKLISTFPEHHFSVRSVAFSRDGKLIASGGDDKAIRLWDAKSCKLISTLTGHKNAVYSVVFSPDSKLIASGSFDKNIRLWDTKTAKHISTFVGHQNVVYSVAFSPDGKFIASGSSDNTIRLWDVKTGKHISIFKGHKYEVFSVTFSPDGKFIASGSSDNTIRIWGQETMIIHLLPDENWGAVRDNKVVSRSENAGRYLFYKKGLARVSVDAFD